MGKQFIDGDEIDVNELFTILDTDKFRFVWDIMIKLFIHVDLFYGSNEKAKKIIDKTYDVINVFNHYK